MEPAEYRGGGGSKALFVMGLICLGAGFVVAYLFYDAYDEAQATIEEQTQQIQGLQSDKAALQQTVSDWQVQSGFDTTEAMKVRLEAIPGLTIVEAQQAIEELSDRARQEKARADDMTKNYETAAQELENLRQQLQDTMQAKDTEVKKRDEAQAQMEADYKAQLGKRDQLIASLRDEKRKLEDDLQDMHFKLEETTAELKKEVLDKEGQITQLRDKLRIVQEKIEEPDGYIVAFNNRTGYGTINLGSKDHVEPGLVFQVYSLGRGGEAVPKGRVQVRQVEEHSSVVGVIEEVPNDPIIKGDSVVNPLLAKKKPVVVIAGWFPPSLGYTADELKFLVERWGGKVSEEVSLDTDLLVVGRTRTEGPDVTPEAKAEAEQGLNAYNLARELAIRIYDVTDFLKLVRR